MNRRFAQHAVLAFGGWVWATGCGGSEPARHTTPPAAVGPSTPETRPEPRQEEALQVEGLLGTLPSRHIRGALEPRIPRFAKCFEERYDDIEILGGEVVLAFRVNTEGAVSRVSLSSSTVGDRETEHCLLDIAGDTQFAQPQGGEAEFEWPLALDPPEGLRPPVVWTPDVVSDQVKEHRNDVFAECGKRGMLSVTAYVAPGGRVLTAGASTEDESMVDALDCVAEAVEAWEMPDPGSYPSKVTFELH